MNEICFDSGIFSLSKQPIFGILTLSSLTNAHMLCFKNIRNLGSNFPCTGISKEYHKLRLKVQPDKEYLFPLAISTHNLQRFMSLKKPTTLFACKGLHQKASFYLLSLWDSFFLLCKDIQMPAAVLRWKKRKKRKICWIFFPDRLSSLSKRELVLSAREIREWASVDDDAFSFSLLRGSHENPSFSSVFACKQGLTSSNVCPSVTDCEGSRTGLLSARYTFAKVGSNIKSHPVHDLKKKSDDSEGASGCDILFYSRSDLSAQLFSFWLPCMCGYLDFF